MPVFIDTHAHYFDRKFDPNPHNFNGKFDGQGGADALLNHPDFRAVVSGVINVGTNLVNSRTAVDMAKKYPFMAAAVGIHPEDAQGLPDGTPLDPEATLTALEVWVSDPQRRRDDKIVAIGEAGLDYHWQPVNKELQMTFFEGQMEIARRTGLPVIIHDREAHGDCFETILRYPDVTGVFHCYSGSAEMARELVKRGWYIAFGGVVTFPTAHRVREAVSAVPLSHLLLETDCPYMAPVPFRGKINHSALIPYIAEVIAPLHGITPEELAEAVNGNARRLFRLDEVLI